jgi:hypothetical protein
MQRRPLQPRKHWRSIPIYRLLLGPFGPKRLDSRLSRQWTDLLAEAGEVDGLVVTARLPARLVATRLEEHLPVTTSDATY